MPPSSHADDEFMWCAGLSNLEYALLAGADGAHRLGLRGIQLLGAGYRQHGSAHALWPTEGAEAKVACPLMDGEIRFRVPDDRAGGGVVGRDQHRGQHHA